MPLPSVSTQLRTKISYQTPEDAGRDDGFAAGAAVAGDIAQRTSRASRASKERRIIRVSCGKRRTVRRTACSFRAAAVCRGRSTVRLEMAGDEFGMLRHGRHGALDQGAYVGEKAVELHLRQSVGERVIADRLDALADHHLQPAHRGEQFLAVAKDVA